MSKRLVSIEIKKTVSIELINKLRYSIYPEYKLYPVTSDTEIEFLGEQMAIDLFIDLLKKNNIDFNQIVIQK